MPRGQPDFGMYAPETYIAGLSDMAELAVRLGSIVTFDRRGKVIDLDDFEGPLLRWYVFETGDSHTRFSSTGAKSGTQSIRMQVGDADSNESYMGRGVALVGSKRIGVEMAYVSPSATAYLVIWLHFDDGVIAYNAKIKLDFSTLKLSYLDSGDEFQEIADIPEPAAWKFLYYPIKFVADFDTGKYVRLMYGGVEYDLSAYNLRSVDPAGAPAIAVYVYWTRISGGNSNIWLDDYILTMEEP